MTDKNTILKKVSKIEDKLLVSKMLDRAERAENKGIITFSDFLDPYQKNIVEKALSGSIDAELVFNGGYGGAEREVAIFCPNNMPAEDLEEHDLPLKLLYVKLKARENLSHRDFLGSLMGLGIKREKVGDIIVKEESCEIVVMDEIAEFIKFNLVKVGNTNVDSEIRDIGEINAPEPKVKEINTTVASLRLDSIASAGFGISRSKMVEFIKGEKVNLNWESINSVTKQVKEGDTISIRGKGRVVVEKVNGMTKKGRIAVALKRLI